MRDTYQNIARTMINRVVMQDMKSLATGGQTQFGLDIARGFDVELNGVGKVSRDFATACDQFAKFVTRDQTATYSTLSVQMRRKAQLAMSLVQQGVPNAGAFGFGVLLSPNLNRNKLAIGNGPAQYTFSLSFDENGGLSLTMRGVLSPGAIGIGNDLHPCGPGSVVNIDVDVRIDQLEPTCARAVPPFLRPPAPSPSRDRRGGGVIQGCGRRSPDRGDWRGWRRGASARRGRR